MKIITSLKPEIPKTTLPRPASLAPQIVFSPAAIASLPAESANENADIKSAIEEGLRLSFIVYDPLAHLARELETTGGYTHIQKLNMPLTGTQGLCCVKDSTAYIAFRGSASPLDWIMDFLFIPFYWPLCHFGFGSAWWSVKGKARRWLQSLPREVDSVVLCGHSLGGGVSHMAALDLAKDFNIESVVTFGAPKACFLWTAERYNKTEIHGRDKKETLGTVTYAVVNQRDIVSKVPFEFIGFRDVGQLIYIDQSSQVHYGSAASDARFRDSMTDMDFLFNFMEEEKIGALGPHSNSTEKFYYNMRKVMAWAGRVMPVLKSIILPSLMYVLFSMYFLRSGLAHLGDKYMSVFTDQPPSWHYAPYEKTKVEKFISLSIRLVLGVVLAGLFLWGLVTIATWSVEGMTKKNPA